MSYKASVLFAASECVPFAKAGGLGDVVGALPRALAKAGHDVRVVLPLYGTIRRDGFVRHPAPLGVPLGDGERWCGLWESRLPDSNVPVYFIEHGELFSRKYIYDPPGGSAGDNLTRFSLLSRGVLQVCRALRWSPNVIHVHDWPTSLVPIYLNTTDRSTELGRTATVLTLHNVAHQGLFDLGAYGVTGLPRSELHARSLLDDRAINLLQGGIYHCSKLTTVSPRYAHEIRTPAGGMGLESVIGFKGADLLGILNGIDEDVWNPETDPNIPAHFSADDLSGKDQCKLALQRELGLDESLETPLISIVSRMTRQKGTDVIAQCLDRILAMGAQIAMLGSGDPEYERFFGMRSHGGGGRFRAWIGFNEPLSHRLEAGADLFLMPSRFEPCGLNQMYSQRYGTLPIVRNTGGLHDTVESFDPNTGAGTGFVFDHLAVDALTNTVAWALQTYATRRDAFRAMQIRAMKRDFSWRLAAEKYADAYRWAMESRGGH